MTVLILIAMAFFLGLAAGLSLSGYLWGKACKALADLILARRNNADLP